MSEHGRIEAPYQTTGGGREQWFFQTPRDLPIKNGAKLHGLPIDIRGTGGYVIVPPSNHISGRTYTWEVDPFTCSLPKPETWLLDWIGATGTLESPQQRLDVPARSASTFLDSFAPTEQLENHPGCSEGQRNATLCRLTTGYLNRRGPAGAMEAALAWANRCIPPYPEGEVRRTVEAQMQFVGTSRPAVKATITSVDQTVPTYARITSAELFHGDWTVDYLVDNVLVAGQPCILAGPQKTLKTSLAIDFAIALSRGGKFLGHFPATRTAKVCMMSGESGMATLRSTANRICESQDWRLSDLSMIWSPDLPRFGSLEHLRDLEQFCLNDGIEVLLIDPAYLCMPSADTANVFAQGELLATMSKLCQSMGVTLVLLHHCRKSSENSRAYQPIELTDIAWAGFGEFARQWLLIGRRERFAAGTGENRLWLTIGGSAGHSGLYAVDINEGTFPDRKWEVTVQSAVDALQTQQADKERKRIEQTTRQAADDERVVLDALQTQSPNTANGIRELTGIRQPRLGTALRSQIKAGRIRETVVDKGNNRSYDGFEIVPDVGKVATTKSHPAHSAASGKYSANAGCTQQAAGSI